MYYNLLELKFLLQKEQGDCFTENKNEVHVSY